MEEIKLKKAYDSMELEVIRFESEDIITTSCNTKATDPVTEGFPIS